MSDLRATSPIFEHTAWQGWSEVFTESELGLGATTLEKAA